MVVYKLTRGRNTMNSVNRMVLASTLLSVCFSVSAEKVYETVNDQGVVEFSDHPSAGSEQVDVKPNVVDTQDVPANSLSTTTPSSAPAKPRQPSNSQEQEYYGAGVYHDDEDRRQRAMQQERKTSGQPIESRGVQRSGQGHATGAAAHGAAKSR